MDNYYLIGNFVFALSAIFIIIPLYLSTTMINSCITANKNAENSEDRTKTFDGTAVTFINALDFILIAYGIFGIALSSICYELVHLFGNVDVVSMMIRSTTAVGGMHILAPSCIAIYMAKNKYVSVTSAYLVERLSIWYACSLFGIFCTIMFLFKELNV